MRTVTISQAKRELQNIADQVGAKRFLKAKGLYFDKVLVTGEDGSPMSAEDLEVHVAPKAMPEMPEEDEEVKAMNEEEDEEEVKAENPFAAMEEEEDEEESKKSKAFKKNARRKAYAPVVSKRPSKMRKVKFFKDDQNGSAVDKAIGFGHWLNAQVGIKKSMDYCDRHGLRFKAHSEGVNSAGGFLVPEVFETELINLREEYGVARQECRVRNMTTDVHRIPRRSATLTPYFVGEAVNITESTQTFEQVSLIAKKLAVLTTVSSELDEDAFINVADDVANEIAYAFAKREDECLFLGDGTSTYGGIVGLANAMASGNAGIVQTTEMSADTLAKAQEVVTIEFLTDAMATLPHYADTKNCKWYFHKTTYHALVQNRALNAGGVTQAEILNGKIQPQLFGYPVVFSQTLPDLSTLTDTLRIGYFGDLTLAASFGDRRSTQIQVSDQAMDVFEQDEIAIRGTERFDINCHDVGDSSNVGPLVALELLNAS